MHRVVCAAEFPGCVLRGLPSDSLGISASSLHEFAGYTCLTSTAYWGSAFADTGERASIFVTRHLTRCSLDTG